MTNKETISITAILVPDFWKDDDRYYISERVGLLLF